MGNMTYCRFNNTSIDLEDCIEAMDGDEIESKTEWNTMKSMVEQCERFIESAERTVFTEEEEE